MSIVDFVGWASAALTLLSFTVNDIFKLRLINLMGCFTWIAFGVMSKSNQVIVTNVTIALIHLYWFLKKNKA